MDEDRFDRVARTLAELRSRRSTMPFLGASALAALGISSSVQRAFGKGKGKGKGKKCKKGEKKCGKKCFDLDKTFKHCGKCDNECDPGQQCQLGTCLDTCETACTSPLVCCVDECVDTTSEAQHCGSCFKACAENEVCRFANCGCLGPRCPVSGSNETRCCPDANGTCCEGGRCCPNSGICITSGLCFDAGYYQCPGLDVCCQVGLICDGFLCVFPERDAITGAQRSIPAKKAMQAQ